MTVLPLFCSPLKYLALDHCFTRAQFAPAQGGQSISLAFVGAGVLFAVRIFKTR